MRTTLVLVVAASLVSSLIAAPAQGHVRSSGVWRQRRHEVRRAKARLDGGYCWGGTRGCYDCSGFTYRVFYRHGARLPHSSSDQWRARHRTGWRTIRRRSNLRKGDLVFFEDTYRNGVSHVGMYVGNDRFIHASSSDGVRTNSLNEGYYKRHLKAGVRPRHNSS
ncbi:MAG: C40 family peptidase [Actinomycetota bacterium]